MEYRFYGAEDHGLSVNNPLYPKIHTPHDLYALLETVWCEYTCAPRLRHRWSSERKTVGQCSVTAFLAQDILGGEVYGILLNDGSVHCFNRVNGHEFDLTSEQLGEAADYGSGVLQSRDVHFAGAEKKERYLYLKEMTEKKMTGAE